MAAMQHCNMPAMLTYIIGVCIRIFNEIHVRILSEHISPMLACQFAAACLKGASQSRAARSGSTPYSTLKASASEKEALGRICLGYWKRAYGLAGRDA